VFEDKISQFWNNSNREKVIKMYIPLILLGIFFVLGIAALLYFTRKSDRAYVRSMESHALTPKPVKRDKV
jgi:hypothetical protein